MTDGEHQNEGSRTDGRTGGCEDQEGGSFCQKKEVEGMEGGGGKSGEGVVMG